MAIFTKSPIHQIKNLAKVSRYTVLRSTFQWFFTLMFYVQAHAQTIDILVSEKSKLQAELSRLQKELDSRKSESAIIYFNVHVQFRAYSSAHQ